jgi:four helix bundle protein
MTTTFSVFDKAHLLVLDVYRSTKGYPSEEKFGLVSQMRRCAVSIAANLAEGNNRHTRRDRHNFVVIADGSLQELKYYLRLSHDLCLISNERFIDMKRDSEEIGRMLNGLRNYLNSDV